jgi:hypothetical protein
MSGWGIRRVANMYAAAENFYTPSAWCNSASWVQDGSTVPLKGWSCLGEFDGSSLGVRCRTLQERVVL